MEAQKTKTSIRKILVCERCGEKYNVGLELKTMLNCRGCGGTLKQHSIVECVQVAEGPWTNYVVSTKEISSGGPTGASHMTDAEYEAHEKEFRIK